MDQKKYRSEYRYMMTIFKNEALIHAPINRWYMVIGWKGGRKYGGPAIRREHQWFGMDGKPLRVDWWARFPKTELSDRW